MNRTLHLNAFLMTIGHHQSAWRFPESDLTGTWDVGHYRHLARTAEQGLFDSIFFGDGPSLQGDIRYRPVGRLDPTALLPALAAVTEHIGLVATGSTTYNEPYNLARRFATIDHISGGRVGWNIVTTAGREAAQNFGLDDGRFFRVKGPLNVPRTPQGYPLLVQAGSSDDGRGFAARYAEAVFTAHAEPLRTGRLPRPAGETDPAPTTVPARWWPRPSRLHRNARTGGRRHSAVVPAGRRGRVQHHAPAAALRPGRIRRPRGADPAAAWTLPDGVSREHLRDHYQLTRPGNRNAAAAAIKSVSPAALNVGG